MVKLHIQLNIIEFELDVECHFLHSVNYKQFDMEFYFFFTFKKQSLTNSSNIYAKLCKVHWNFEHLQFTEILCDLSMIMQQIKLVFT